MKYIAYLPHCPFLRRQESSGAVRYVDFSQHPCTHVLPGCYEVLSGVQQLRLALIM